MEQGKNKKFCKNISIIIYSTDSKFEVRHESANVPVGERPT